MFVGLPTDTFDVVYTDPPWHYYGSTTKDAAAGKHYDLLGLDELTDFPMRSLMTKRAALFLWATGPKLHYATELIERWGLHYRGVAWVWVKTRMDGAIINGQGVPPTFTKPTTEFVLSATTMPRGRPFPICNFKQAQVILAPRGEHSSKPQQVRANIEELCGDVKYLELFAREHADGWTSWGDELGVSPQASPPRNC